MKTRLSSGIAGSLVLALWSSSVYSQVPPAQGFIEVTATKVAEDVDKVPASITIISGDDLRARNATDLATALGAVAGVSAAPGGDAGPASSVPELWGLKEFDAFLLVVDGVPWGGAFNPDLQTLDLNDIDRIEVLRGAAPVMYGATSFVGIINVIHRAAGSAGRTARLAVGNHGSGTAAVALPLSESGVRQSLNASIERKGFRDDRTGFDRGHVLYRAGSDLGAAKWHFDLDFNALRQDPASPHPRQGRVLSNLVPLDANHNPRNARIDEDRIQASAGWDSSLATIPWSTTVSLTHSKFDITRGFLAAVEESPLNASGFRQNRSVTDVYFDSHLVKKFSPTLQVIAGFDHLYGRGTAENGLFDYTVALNGSGAPNAPESDEENRLTDQRQFSGLYVNGEWNPLSRLRLDIGARLNRTIENSTGQDPDGSRKDRRMFTRGSGVLGATFRLLESGGNNLFAFADYRNTFKPAAIDFGPEAEGEILNPETAKSYEGGLKGRLLDGRLFWQASAFELDFENLVVPILIDGLPALENVGSERFRGIEVETDMTITSVLRWATGYSYHDARFRDYAPLFDGVPMQLSGNRLEMSPRNMFGTSLIYSPAQGLNANILFNYVGDRYLNKRNTALAAPYRTWAAGLGYRFAAGELRVDGRNLTDKRPPIAESELGDAQYYRLPSRSYELTYRRSF
ncbi:MAG TPA: TonB-dependent receptor [Thermoanaerobaculia bacterium]|nr:TonB-dependent receptor [Thermoanaerobaculia bacterium]